MIADLLADAFTWAVVVIAVLVVVAYLVLFVWYVLAPWLTDPEGSPWI